MIIAIIAIVALVLSIVDFILILLLRWGLNKNFEMDCKTSESLSKTVHVCAVAIKKMQPLVADLVKWKAKCVEILKKGESDEQDR